MGLALEAMVAQWLWLTLPSAEPLFDFAFGFDLALRLSLIFALRQN